MWRHEDSLCKSSTTALENSLAASYKIKHSDHPFKLMLSLAFTQMSWNLCPHTTYTRMLTALSSLPKLLRCLSSREWNWFVHLFAWFLFLLFALLGDQAQALYYWAKSPALRQWNTMGYHGLKATEWLFLTERSQSETLHTTWFQLLGHPRKGKNRETIKSSVALR